MLRRIIVATTLLVISVGAAAELRADLAGTFSKGDDTESPEIEVPPAGPEHECVVRHVMVYDEPSRYAGWPANGGFWMWGNEMAVAFECGWFEDRPDWQDGHARDDSRGNEDIAARSSDGGLTWTHKKYDIMSGDDGIRDIPEGMDFGKTGFGFKCQGERFYYTYDSGRSWSGPYRIKITGLPGADENIESHTCYIINGKNDGYFFFGVEPDDAEDRFYCTRTTDGGKTFAFLGWISPPPEKAPKYERWAVYSGVKVSENHLIAALRRKINKRSGRIKRLNWIDVYESKDSGKTWSFLSKVTDTDVPNSDFNGNPPSILKLQDGRLCVTYGFRARPCVMCAKFSADNGKTWSKPIILRTGARNWDFGYSRSLQRPDGKVVTVYYFATPDNRDQFITATIWDPALVNLAGGCLTAAQVKHVIAYKEPGRFCSWPANYGTWSWGNEILVGFKFTHYQEKDRGHSYNRDKPVEYVAARSLDGGETWKLERPKGLDTKTRPIPCPGRINFTHPDFALRCRSDIFSVSYDRGKSWSIPYKIPDVGREDIMARTDYIVNGRDNCLIFLTASKTNGKEGQPFSVRTTDGGRTLDFVSWISPEPSGFSIMPSTIRVSENQLLSAMRRKEQGLGFIDVYSSDDDGKTWQFLNKPAETGRSNGNPASMVRLKDGRIVLTYGYRSEPRGIRAKISSDKGKTWGEEIHLRDDGRTWDLGYPQTVLRPDGKLVTLYYYTTEQNPEQHIAATIWRAPILRKGAKWGPDPDNVQ